MAPFWKLSSFSLCPSKTKRALAFLPGGGWGWRGREGVREDGRRGGGRRGGVREGEGGEEGEGEVCVYLNDCAPCQLVYIHVRGKDRHPAQL